MRAQNPTKGKKFSDELLQQRAGIDAEIRHMCTHHQEKSNGAYVSQSTKASEKVAFAIVRDKNWFPKFESTATTVHSLLVTYR